MLARLHSDPAAVRVRIDNCTMMAITSAEQMDKTENAVDWTVSSYGGGILWLAVSNGRRPASTEGLEQRVASQPPFRIRLWDRRVRRDC